MKTNEKLTARLYRDDVLRLREEIRDELRDIAKRSTENDLEELKETIWESRACDSPVSARRALVVRPPVGEIVLAKGGLAMATAIILFISGAWTFDNFGNHGESASGPAIKLEPITTYKVEVPVKEPMMRDEVYTVRVPVTKTVWEEETYKVQKAVPSTEYRNEIVKTYKPFYYTVMERREVTVPTLSLVQVNVGGFWTNEWRYVDSVQTQLTPVRKQRLKLVEKVRKVPVETLRYIEEERTRKVPVQRTVYVEEQRTRQVPANGEDQRYALASTSGTMEPAPTLSNW